MNQWYPLCNARAASTSIPCRVDGGGVAAGDDCWVGGGCGMDPESTSIASVVLLCCSIQRDMHLSAWEKLQYLSKA
eukprot:7379711-Prymnesium_polylepis.1